MIVHLLVLYCDREPFVSKGGLQSSKGITGFGRYCERRSGFDSNGNCWCGADALACEQRLLLLQRQKPLIRQFFFLNGGSLRHLLNGDRERHTLRSSLQKQLHISTRLRLAIVADRRLNNRQQFLQK